MHLLKFLTLLLTLTFASSCSTTEEEKRPKYDFRASKYSRDETAAWRSETLPKLLIVFKYDDARKWRNNRALLIKDERTPKDIRELLIADDALTVKRRDELAREGMIYKMLATFNSENREAWQEARIMLMRMDEETQERCIFELIRRMQYGPKYEKYDEFSLNEQAEGDFKNISKNLEKSFRNYNYKLNNVLRSSKITKNFQVQKAFWASQELAIIGKPTVKYLLFSSKLASSGFFSDMIFSTLAQIGEDAVPDIVNDLQNTEDLPTSELIFFHKRVLIKCLGNLYHNINFIPDELDDAEKRAFKNQRKKLKLSKEAVKEITIQLRDYVPDNEYLEFQFWLESIFALRKIGVKSGCIPIIEIWKKIEDDRELERQIKIALLDISGRQIKTLKGWQQYAKSLTDPEDF